MDEIPEAIRVRESINETKRSSVTLVAGGVLCLVIVGSLAIFLASSSKQPQPTVSSLPAKSKVETDNSNTEAVSSPSPPANAQALKPTSSFDSNSARPDKENLLGHLPYQEVSEANLESITANGSVRLHPKAAAKFREMQAAARAEGVILTPISGFRSVKAQEQLFFGVKEQRVQDAVKRAEVSAPPGYSEHHTGYAIDIGDGKVPAANVEPEFENTAAFRWLQANAARYSFELSFPLNNSQGISYEPWHWRYVGDRQSLETFYKVNNEQ
ncbi:D-alanyl-D-alanine carboxypeptidase family protein [Myxosarcina sp. GI1]|uniref:M15 family metallopeptidase n=1 Tax=Myxosarcina sp. GI1 TaxID=1541065 RepID=UPI00056CC39A|nr:M15 family metallopeptidase [Myxosarcina sp. GI1]